MRILIVEDHEIIAKNIFQFLKIEGFAVSYVHNCSQAQKELEHQKFDLMILDLNLPDKNGKDFCEELRTNGNTIPIIMLTSSDTQKDIILGLKSGADDYISKPFDYDELLARIQSVLRRGEGSIGISDIQKIGDIEIHFEKKQVFKKGLPIYLSTLEYRLYEYLVKNAGKIIGRNELYDEVWGDYDTLMFSRTVDVYVNYVRNKLGKNAISTRRGEGYFVDM